MILFLSYICEKEYEKVLLQVLNELSNEIHYEKNRLFNSEIEKRILESDVVLCILTNKYLQDGNCRRELFYSNNLHKRCIYLYLEKIDGNLANEISMYLCGEALRIDILKFDFDYLNEICFKLKTTVSEQTKAIVPDWSIELIRNEWFHGRDDILNELEKNINKNISVCLNGMTGVGKTSCVIEFIHRQLAHKKHVLWFDTDCEIKIFEKICFYMNKMDSDRNSIIRAFLEYVNHSSNIILVFDNLENIQYITNMFKLEELKASCIITSTLNKIENIKMIQVMPFSLDEATSFIENTIPKQDIKKRNRLIKWLGKCDSLLPSKLSLLTGLLNNPIFSMNKIIKNCNYNDMYAKIIVKKLNYYCYYDEIKILKVAVLLDADNISYQLLKRIKLNYPIKIALQNLADIKLVTIVFPNSPQFGIRIHRMVQKKLKTYLENKISNELIIEVMKVIKETFNLHKPNNIVPHALKIMEYYNITRESRLSLTIFENLALYFGNCMENHEMELKYWLECLKIMKKMAICYQPEIVGIIIKIATAFERMGDIESALVNYHYALSMEEEFFKGSDHPKLAFLMNNIGVFYEKTGENKKAFIYYTKALEMQNRLFKTDCVQLSQLFSNLAYSCEKLGDNENGLKLKVKALEIQKQLLASDHPDIAKSLKSIACSFTKIGDNKKALEYKQQILKIRKKIHHYDHPDIAKSLNSLGVTLTRLGEHTKAFDFYKQALEIRLRQLGSVHPDVAESYINIAVSWERLGNDEKALQYKQRALDLRQKIFKSDHPFISKTYDTLAVSYARLGNNEKALEYYKKSLDMRKSLYNFDHPDTLESLINVSISFKRLGDEKRASEYYKLAVEMETKLNNSS